MEFFDDIKHWSIYIYLFRYFENIGYFQRVQKATRKEYKNEQNEGIQIV